MPRDSLLSTAEVAGLLNLAETTVKRWADDGTLACIRTPGGHRKFQMAEVIRFAEEHQYPLTGILMPPLSKSQKERLAVGISTTNYKLLCGILLEELLQADRNGTYELLAYLYRHQIPLCTIADEVIRPAMEALGKLWAEKKLQVNQEHLASQALHETLMRLGPQIHRKPSNGLSMVCACPESELHDLGLLLLAYTFKAEGWSVQNIGANTPMHSLATHIKAHKPNAICLSITMRPRGTQAIDDIRTIGKLAHSLRSTFIVGGIGVPRKKPELLHCHTISPTITGAIRYTQDIFELKPGPKKHRESR